MYAPKPIMFTVAYCFDHLEPTVLINIVVTRHMILYAYRGGHMQSRTSMPLSTVMMAFVLSHTLSLCKVDHGIYTLFPYALFPSDKANSLYLKLKQLFMHK